MNEASPRPWSWEINDDDQLMLYDKYGNPLGQLFDHGCEAEANLIVDAVNTLAEFEAAHMEFPDFRQVIIAAGQRDAAIAERDELRDLCVLLFDAVKHGNQVTDLPAIWNKAEEVLKRTDPEKKP